MFKNACHGLNHRPDYCFPVCCLLSLGVVYQLIGNVSAVFSGIVVDKTQKHRMVCIGAVLCAAVALLVLTVAEYELLLWEQTTAASLKDSWQLNIAIPIALSLSALGLAAWMSVGLEFGTALTYPADEAAVGGVLQAFAQFFGFLWVSIGGALIESVRSAFSALLTFATLLALLLLTVNRAESRRPSDN